MSAIAILTAFGLLGLAGGSVSLAGLRLVADLFVRRRAARAAALQIARLAAVTGVFACIVRFGAGALLAALAGFVAARTFAIPMRARRA
jgi:hypothetical protein